MNYSIFQRLQLFSDPSRIRLLRILQRGEFTVGELTTILETSQPTVSRHLKQLLEQDLVARRSEGTASFYQSTLALRSSHDQQLFQIVHEEYKDHEEEDERRAESVLALRSIDSSSFFRHIGSRWHDLRHALFGSHYLLPTLLQLVDPDIVVADIGCGPGEALRVLSPCVHKVIGIDRSEDMLGIAKQRCETLDNVDLRLGRAEDLPLKNGEANLILCMLLLHHVTELEPVFDSIAKGMAEGGRMIVLDLQAHDRDELKKQLGHQHLGFSERRISQLASDNFDVIHYTPLSLDPSAMAPPLFISCLKKR